MYPIINLKSDDYSYTKYFMLMIYSDKCLNSSDCEQQHEEGLSRARPASGCHGDLPLAVSFISCRDLPCLPSFSVKILSSSPPRVVTTIKKEPHISREASLPLPQTQSFVGHLSHGQQLFWKIFQGLGLKSSLNIYLLVLTSVWGRGGQRKQNCYIPL